MDNKYSPVITAFQKMAQQIVNKLENENVVDMECMLDYGMDGTLYKGKIRGRKEAIELIKKRFELE